MMPSQKFLRDLQSRFGYLLDLKTDFQRSFRKFRKIPFEAEFEILNVLTPQGRCAIDVGANRGQSIDAIRLYHPKVQIYSFEPNKPLFEKLVFRFEADTNLDVQNMGLGRNEQTAKLFVPFYRKFMYDGLSSFTEERASKWLNEKTVWRFDPRLLRVERHLCHIDVLDKFSLEPFFLKIHVQGFEKDVLFGAKHTIRSHCPVLLMANNEDANIWLRDEGWTQYAFIGGKLIELEDNDLGIYNCLYLHDQNQEHRDIVKALT